MASTLPMRVPALKALASEILCDPSCPLWLTVAVPRKKKPKPFRATTAVKAMARTAIGAPPPVKRKESKKRGKAEKHRPSMGKLLSESE